MRKVIDYFIKYHVAVNLLIIAFVLFGLLGYNSLKSSFFPITDSHNIEVLINYPGASPLEIEQGIILKIEDNLKGLVGVERVTSVSKENSGSIIVEVEKELDINYMLLEVKNSVDRVPSYPMDMEPLIISKIENKRSTISFAITGENTSLLELKKIGQQIENDLRSIEGISQIIINGYPDEEIEISVNESDLLAYGLTFSSIVQAIKRSNIILTGGLLKTDAEEFLIRVNNKSYYADGISNIEVLSRPDGSRILLKEVAEINDQFSESPNRLYVGEDISIQITVNSTNSENLISSASSVRNYIDKYNIANKNAKISVLSDQSVTLEERTKLMAKNIFQGMILVLIFLSLFLNSRLAFWVAFGIPISFFGMLIFASMFGVTINVLSTFGMIIVIGILVDDAIVISENIYQQYEKGKSPYHAAIDGVMEVLPPVVSAIVTTILAFSLFLFLDSRIGEYFAEVAIVVILTLIISLIEALILLPAHLANSKALIKNKKVSNSFFEFAFSKLRIINKLGDAIMQTLRDYIYEPFLKFSLNNRLLVLSVFLGCLSLTIGSFEGGIIRTSFFPSIASDRISISLLMPNGTNERITDSIISFIQKKSEIVNKEFSEKYLKGTGKLLFVNTIKTLGQGSSKAGLIINLLPGEQRPDIIKAKMISSRLTQLVGPVVGVESLVIGSGQNFGGKPISVSLLSNNIGELKKAKNELKQVMQSNVFLKDITDNDPTGIKEITIQLKDNAYSLGLDLEYVMSRVRSGFFGVQAQRFQRGRDEIRIWVRFKKEDRSSITKLEDMKIDLPGGKFVAIKEICSYSIKRGDLSINHLDGRREIQVSADLKNEEESSSFDIMEDLKNNIIPEIQKKYPSISATYEGQNREADKLKKSIYKAGIPILLLIYLTIAFTFRSYSQPLLLFLLIPISLIGVSWGHWIHGFTVNILSLLGVVALIGIMVNDGLVFIGKFNNNLKHGMFFNEGLIQAGKSRFRAIFLTSITTVAGLTPLLLEKSRQAQFLKPMAITVSYGIAFATLLTLIVLPIFISINNQLKVNIKWLISGDLPSKESIESSVKEIKFKK
jgi:multidrug efflux pump subunit AcrB